MTVLYLTNNAKLAGTARILLSWLELGARHGISGRVVLPSEGELSETLTARGIPWLVSAMRWPDRRWPVPALRDAWQVAGWARAWAPAIVHCNEHDVYPFGRVVARLLGASRVCHVRFQISREFCAWAFGGRRLPGALLWTSNQQRTDCAAAVAGIVPAERQHLVRLGPDLSVFTAASPARAAHRAALGLAPTDVAIGTATALRPVKRLDDFIDAITALAADNPRVVGLMAGGAVPGEEAYASRIQERIANTGLGARLRWLGHLRDVEPFLRCLDVFVSTSEYETFGNSVCEAMACSLPVVGYRGGSVHEIIGDAGVVLSNRDVAGLTAAVARYVDDPDRRSTDGLRGRARVLKELDPQDSFHALCRIYGTLTARSHAIPRTSTNEA